MKPGQHGYNVYVKVVESAIKTVKDTERGDLKIAEGKVGDDSAVIDVRIVGGKPWPPILGFQNIILPLKHKTYLN